MTDETEPATPGVVAVSLVCVFFGGSFVPGLGLVMALVMWFTSLRHNPAARLWAVVLGLFPLLALAGVFLVMQP
jgi:hypothetical protein